MNSAASNNDKTTTDAAEIMLQVRTEAIFSEMAEVARERCAHLFADDESEEG